MTFRAISWFGAFRMKPSFNWDRLKQSLIADLLVPTALISDRLLRHLATVSELQPRTDERDQLLFEVRQALRRYESARNLTIFAMGVSHRSEEAKAQLLHQLDCLHGEISMSPDQLHSMMPS